MKNVFRTTDIALICIMVAAAAFTYKTKHDAESLLSQARGLERRIALERDTINVLKADWSLLSQPGRLQRLTEIYEEELELVPLESTQITTFAQLPARPPSIEQIIDGGAFITGLADPFTTGGIDQ